MPPLSHQQLLVMNGAARNAILGSGIEMMQPIYGNTIAAPGSTANVINIAPRNVGLIKGFVVEIAASINNASAAGVNLTNLGPANLLSQIVFTDLQNNVRINTSGWHLNQINTLRGRMGSEGPYGSAITTDSPVKYGSNWAKVIQAPAAIANGVTSVVNMMYYVPLAFSDADLRGAVYANVVNATMNLQLTINPAPLAAAAADPTLAIYQGSTGTGTITTITINVYQVYLDQLPIGQNGPVLPVLDLATIYEIKNTALQGVVLGQDFPVPFANFRDFLSVYALFNNQTGGAYPTAGSDINYFSLQSANFTNLFKRDPFIQSLLTRNSLGVDTPVPVYLFDFIRKPVSTVQYGNMQLNINPSTVNANASVLVGFENFAMVNMLTGAGSLAAS